MMDEEGNVAGDIVNGVETSTGVVVWVSAVDDVERVALHIIRDEVDSHVILKIDEAEQVQQILAAAITCAGRGHDAVPEIRNGKRHYHCRRCGREWFEYL